jgi:hypothetical protein
MTHMPKAFPKSAVETKELALRLIQHLREVLKDTQGRTEWTSRNLEALRSFPSEGYDLQHFPPAGANRKGAFLWDYVAYQQDTGILIAAETEYESTPTRLKEDFDKLLYVRSPIKVFMFWLTKEEGLFENVVADLTTFMASCSAYSPGEVFILYCRTWQNENSSSGDLASLLQIEGEPCHRDVRGNSFKRVF